MICSVDLFFVSGIHTSTNNEKNTSKKPNTKKLSLPNAFLNDQSRENQLFKFYPNRYRERVKKIRITYVHSRKCKSNHEGAKPIGENGHAIRLGARIRLKHLAAQYPRNGSRSDRKEDRIHHGTNNRGVVEPLSARALTNKSNILLISNFLK